MEREILHVDVNNAFLSWLAVYKLECGEKLDIRTIPSIIGGDGKQTTCEFFLATRVFGLIWYKNRLLIFCYLGIRSI